MWRTFGSISLVVAVLTVYFGLKYQKQSIVAANRREVPGRIVQSEVVNLYDTYVPTIRYEYTYSGRDFIGTTVRTGLLQYNWRGPSERICAKYPVGSTHTVFVNESDPFDAVLEPASSDSLALATVLIGAIFAVFGLIVLFN